MGPFSRTVKMLGASTVEYILGGCFRVIFINNLMLRVQELFKRLGASKTEYSGGWLWVFSKSFSRGFGPQRLNILGGGFGIIFKNCLRGLGP